MDHLGIVVLGACAVWGLSSVVGRRRWSRRADAVASYVHLDWSGRIFLIRGDTGEEAWVDRVGLEAELERLLTAGGSIFYSRDRPAENPPAIVREHFRLIADYRLPIRLVDEPYASASRVA